MKLIGIAGRAGHGKDTIRDMICGFTGAHGMAFADPMRDMIRPLLAMAGAEQYMTDRALKEAPIPGLGVSYRQMMQRLGTEWGRGLDEALWVGVAGRRIDMLRGVAPMVVISDVRFQNEADWIRARGGQVWRVVRPGVPNVADHASERWADQMTPDVEIINGGTLAALQQTVGFALA